MAATRGSRKTPPSLPPSQHSLAAAPPYQHFSRRRADIFDSQDRNGLYTRSLTRLIPRHVVFMNCSLAVRGSVDTWSTTRKLSLGCLTRTSIATRKAIHSADFTFVTITMIAPEALSVAHAA